MFLGVSLDFAIFSNNIDAHMCIFIGKCSTIRRFLANCVNTMAKKLGFNW
jgi:threonyl-tRNA synthetase